MKTKLFLFCLLLTWNLSAQLEFQLFDAASKQPITGAHAFLVNTTFGAISDDQGHIELSFPKTISEDLLITHVAYDTRLIEFADYDQFQLKDSIFLAPNRLILEEIVVTANKNNKWKKRYKTFKKVFLGEDKAAAKCTILNPEVLRFEEKSGQLKATAIDLLHITNTYLGYELYYALKHLIIETDGSSEYVGQAQFIDTSDGNQTMLANRKTAYLQSPKHFFFSLINNNLTAANYEMTLGMLKEEQFVELQTPSPSKLLKEVPGEQYQLYFPEFLKVTHKDIKRVSDRKMGVRSGGLESQRFSGSQTEIQTKVEPALSYLSKISSYILLNKFGNVLNTKSVKEYGFWAERRIAQELPFDYGSNYVVALTEVAKAKEITTAPSIEKLQLFKTLVFDTDQQVKNEQLKFLSNNWETGFVFPLVEILKMSRDAWLINRVNALLKNKTGVQDKNEYYDWLEWLWTQEATYDAYYLDFKGLLYKHIDPKFETYFINRYPTTNIRADEIVWGGVRQDGIPPLRNPKLITATEAEYLGNKDIVFGAYINGEARAYPKRILAWHEFFVDRFDTTTIAGVYCTLCGTVIAYDMAEHDLGTSGFLYRSNKLMYDKATQSLWSTIEGAPVIGPLVNKGISLATHPIVTTTWGEWKKQHPTTKVLSLDTGYDRDYGEGIAYQEYFATDQLMFPVPQKDDRLKNKDEVLIVRAPDYQTDPLAISIKYLRKKRWYQGQIGATSILVLADKTGAARAYDSGAIQFDSYNKGQLRDKQGQVWKVAESYISANGKKMNRLPAHNIFWFAWYNSTPETRLVK